MRKHKRYFYIPAIDPEGGKPQMQAFDMREGLTQLIRGSSFAGYIKFEPNTIASGVHVRSKFIDLRGCADLYKHVSRGKPIGLGENDYGVEMVRAYNVNVRGQRTEESV